MINIAKISCIAAVLFMALPAMAKLRSWPTIESIGLIDDNPLHIATVLDNGTGIASSNGGVKWEKVKRESLPTKLNPLPITGEIRYQVAVDTVMHSKDAGKTWENVSPYFFLRAEVRKEIDSSRQAFNKAFSRWLPDCLYWPIPFFIAALLLLASHSILLFRQHEPWFMAMLLSLSTYLLVGALLWGFTYYYIDMISWRQWTGLESGSWGGMIYPRWPLGIMFLLCGSQYIAPITAMLCFPFTPLFNAKIMTQSRSGKILRFAWGIAALVFVIFIPIALYWGRGQDYYDFP